MGRSKDVMVGKAARPQMENKAKPAAPKRPRRMTIEPLDDGSYHIQHEPDGSEPMAQSKKFSAKNAKHLVRHVRQTFGAPMMDEETE